MERPYVLLSCAMSMDGYIDDATDDRLLLSGSADLDRVDEVRASCDAILVGAGTIRADDPRLVLRSPGRRAIRISRGLAADPMKVALTASGNLDPAARFFTTGEAARILYVTSGAVARTRERLGGVAEVVDAGAAVELDRVLADLAGRGVGRLMVEGGSSVHGQFLTARLGDELQLVVAPVLVGDPRAPRFVGCGSFPFTRQHPARLAEIRQLGNDVLLRYALSDRFGGESPPEEVAASRP